MAFKTPNPSEAKVTVRVAFPKPLVAEVKNNSKENGKNNIIPITRI